MAWNDDPDAVARELNALAPVSDAPALPPEMARLDAWLRDWSAATGSDLLLVAGAPASIRVDGRVSAWTRTPLDGVEIEQAVLPALPPHAPRATTQTQHRRRLPESCRGSAGSASTCTASAAAPPPPSARCPTRRAAARQPQPARQASSCSPASRTASS